MKALTFEESIKELGVGEFDKWIFRRFWDMARIGMIPEDEAVRIPPVSEWPEHMTHLCVEAYDEHGFWGRKLAEIERPTPAWTPKVGEAVFMDDRGQSGLILVGRVDGFNGEGYAMVGTPGTHWFEDYLKPFDASKIGKRWEEI